MTEAEQIMKRCQVGTRNYDEANNLHAECYRVIGKLLKTIEEMESQEPVTWKLMPRDATDAMLKAMDECSTEGYDERLYAGHAASVYMAAWDALDTHQPQRTWVGLTKEELAEISEFHFHGALSGREFYDDIEAKLKEKNNA
jgi:hypothetical protein